MVREPVTRGYGFHSAAAREAAKEMDPAKWENMKRLFSGRQLAILKARVSYQSDEDMVKHGFSWEGECYSPVVGGGMKLGGLALKV
jgi:hypothetical protein